MSYFAERMYTHDDWERDRTFKAREGQKITKELYEELFRIMPIARLKDACGCFAGFRISEPYEHDENGRPLYMAFGVKEGSYYYLGLQ